MKPLNILVICSVVLLSCSHDHGRDAEAISAVLERQRTAWNAGDVEAYMHGYWQSDSLVFNGGKSISHGWQSALDRYKAAYPDREAMGHLLFAGHDLRFLSESSAFSTGQWTLQRTRDTLSGRFTLVWKKVGEEWVIVADHSS